MSKINQKEAKIFPLGDSALTVEFGNEISPEMNRRVLRLAKFFSENSFVGFEEIVPAYSSLTIFYNVTKVKKAFPEIGTAYEKVKKFVEYALYNSNEIQSKESRLIEIPVCFDKQSALDLEFIAINSKISSKEVVEIFLETTYRVFMLGFLPGFAYMGEIDQRIAAPRLHSPRTKVPKGSVGIAGRQTGIYSLESPGGWQIIGRTNIELFTPEADPPTFLKAGDSVRFYESKF